MTAGCETNAGMAAVKKANEAKYKAICTGMREDGAFIEAGENDNLIVQKLEANPGTLGFFGYSFLEENANMLKGIAINGVAPTYRLDRLFKYPGARPLYVYVKNAHVGAIPAIKRLRCRIHEGERVRPEWLSAPGGPDRGAEPGPRQRPGRGAQPRSAELREPQVIGHRRQTTVQSRRLLRSRRSQASHRRRGKGK